VRNYTDNPVKLQLDVAYRRQIDGGHPGRRWRRQAEPAASSEADLEPGTAVLCQRQADARCGNRQGIRGYLGAAGIVCWKILKHRCGSTVDGWEWEEIARRSLRRPRLKVGVMPLGAMAPAPTWCLGFTDGATRNSSQNPGKLVSRQGS